MALHPGMLPEDRASSCWCAGEHDPLLTAAQFADSGQTIDIEFARSCLDDAVLAPHLRTLSAYTRGSCFSSWEGMYGGSTSTSTRLMNWLCIRMKCHSELCTRPHPLLKYLHHHLQVKEILSAKLGCCPLLFTLLKSCNNSWKFQRNAWVEPCLTPCD